MGEVGVCDEVASTSMLRLPVSHRASMPLHMLASVASSDGGRQQPVQCKKGRDKHISKDGTDQFQAYCVILLNLEVHFRTSNFQSTN